jgi:hypothetical protein
MDDRIASERFRAVAATAGLSTAFEAGRSLQRLSRANLRQVKSTQLVDPQAPTRVNVQAYPALLRRTMSTCMESVQKTANVPAQERLRLLRRRLWLSGRRLELLSQAQVFSVEEQARSVIYPQQKPELAAIWVEENGSDATSTSDGCLSSSSCPIICYEVSGIKVWRMALRLPFVDKE